MIRSGHPIIIINTYTAGSASVGVIATEITNARSDLLEWIKSELEEVIDRRRTAGVKDEIDMLAMSILTLAIDKSIIELIARLLGGRKPAKKSRSLHGAGSWGSMDADSYKVCVPRAFAHFGRLVGQVWGAAFGCSLTEDADFGISRRANDAAEQLSAENCLLFLADWGERLTEAALRFRTRRPTELPEIEKLGDEAEDEKLTPIIAKQDAEEAANARADARIAAWVTTSTVASTAGVKRQASGAATKPSPSSSTASAGQPVVATLVQQPAAGTPSGSTAPGQQQPPLSKSAKRKAAAAAKAAALAGGIAVQPSATFAHVAKGGTIIQPTPAQLTQLVPPNGSGQPAAGAPSSATGGGGGSSSSSGWVPSFQPASIHRLYTDSACLRLLIPSCLARLVPAAISPIHPSVIS